MTFFSQLTRGEDIFEAMENSIDPANVEAILSSTQINVKAIFHYKSNLNLFISIYSEARAILAIFATTLVECEPTSEPTSEPLGWWFAVLFGSQLV